MASTYTKSFDQIVKQILVECSIQLPNSEDIADDVQLALDFSQ